MEKLNSILAVVVMFFMTAFSANAQMIEKTNLESYAKQEYGKNWAKAADRIAPEMDNQGNLTFTKEFSAPGLNKNELYIEMANWFICNYDNSIQFADKEQGVLIARPFIENVTRCDGGYNAYDISICPTVRANVSDGKVSITYTLRDYNVMVEEGGGTTAKALAAGLAVATVASAVAVAATSNNHPEHCHTTVVDHYDYGYHHTTVYREYRPHYHYDDALLLSCINSSAYYGPSKDSKTWYINECYPYVSKDSHKKASSKAFIMANVYSQVVMDNIEKAINQCSLACNK